ncbi:MAG: hypothetical protein NTZ84_02900, partial [Candidatus Nealsonbacteria bacterium]|nr:hypothetical protein [Candidatus Nealsonbacteria bacterium]
GIKKVRFFQDETTHHKLFYLWLLPKHQWMEKFGEKIGSIQPIIDYAKENMINDQVFAEVKDMVAKMKEYMKSFKL